MSCFRLPSPPTIQIRRDHLARPRRRRRRAGGRHHLALVLVVRGGPRRLHAQERACPRPRHAGGAVRARHHLDDARRASGSLRRPRRRARRTRTRRRDEQYVKGIMPAHSGRAPGRLRYRARTFGCRRIDRHPAERIPERHHRHRSRHPAPASTAAPAIRRRPPASSIDRHPAERVPERHQGGQVNLASRTHGRCRACPAPPSARRTC